MSRSRAARNRMRRIEKLLLLTGLLCIAVAVAALLRTAVSQDYANWVFDRKLHGQPVSVLEYLKSRLEPGPNVPPLPGKPPVAQQKPPAPSFPTYSSGDLIGRLAIPRLKLAAMVREGSGARTLDIALGHIPGTAFPGEDGNVAVAGHRDTLFRGLGGVHKSDRIEFQTLHGTYEYEVESTQIVKPNDVAVLNPASYPEITLVTCYPFHYIGSAPDRFIVKARLVTADPYKKRQIVQVAQAAPNPVKGRPGGLPHQGVRKVFFRLAEGHSRTLIPGISLGLEWADSVNQRVNGWMWVMPDRRTIRVTGQHSGEPLVFYGHEDGRRRELVITNIGRDWVSGYLQVYGG